MPECQPFSKAFNWLTLPGIFWFDHPFWVAQFHRNGGSLYSGMVAQYAPDYSMGALAMDDTAHHNLFSSYFKSGLQPVSPSNGRSVDGLLDWVTGQGFCTTHTWFYLAGNHNLVSALRHELRALGFLSSQIRVKGFWS